MPPPRILRRCHRPLGTACCATLARFGRRRSVGSAWRRAARSAGIFLTAVSNRLLRGRAIVSRMPQSPMSAPLAERQDAGVTACMAVSSQQLAAHDGSPPEWVHLIPAGVFFGRDGRGPYRLNAEAVMAAFLNNNADLPIDYDHQTLSAEEKAGPVPVAGWITALEQREDGLWARASWTERAAALLAAREYRYLSPVFRHTPDGEIVELLGAALTHMPNLRLTAAASREDLPAGAAEPAAPGGDAEPAFAADLADALGVAPNAGREEMVAAARRLRDRAEKPDPAHWVSAAQHRALAQELAKLKAAIAERDAADAVAAATRAGKLAPSLHDWALEYARRDPGGFAAFVAAAPVVVGQQVNPSRAAVSDLEAQIAEADAEIARAAQAGQRLRFSDALAIVRNRMGVNA